MYIIFQCIYISTIIFISLGAKTLDKIQIYTAMYEYKIKNVLYKSSSYEEHMAEKSFESD